MIGLLIAVMFLHWLGDFVIQTKWMAENKSKSMEALTLHVVCYSLVLFVGLWVSQQWTVNDLCRYTLINLAVHWAVDCMTSRLTKIAVEKRNKHQFFAIIGFDQFLHATTLLLTTYYLLWPIY